MEKVNNIEDAMKFLRSRFPTMRRTRATAIVHSGGRRTIFGCLCGREHTASTDWNGRAAKHVIEWRAEHDDCAIKLANKIIAKEKDVFVYFGR